MADWSSRFPVFTLSILGAIGLTLILTILVMQPPLNDMLVVALLLGGTGAVSAGIVYFSNRMGWWRRFGRISWILTLGYVMAGALTLINVWVTARLMFINEHDLALATMLLVFSALISIAFGYFFSTSITQTLRDLAQGAERVSEGDFSVRIPALGRDEVARLAETFNQMTERLERAAEEHAALDEARKNLIAGASHDLRTPLASLRAMVEALADGVASDPLTVERYLRQSQSEISRLSALINDLFDLAQLETGHVEIQRENSSLSDLLSDTLSSFSARAEARGVRLEGSAAPSIDPVYMAPDKISRVLSNLLDNALRYTPRGGTIRITAQPHDSQIRISVRDTGPGIAASDLPHIFDRFYRGEKSRSRDGYDVGGAGLGLAIAKRLVEAHGGEMQAQSVEGQGTTVLFTLPRSLEKALIH